MALDNPIDAAKSILASEEREHSPVRMYAARVAEFVPGPIGKALLKVLSENSAKKLEYLIEVLNQEFVYLHERVDRLLSESAEHRQFAEHVWPALALDALRKTEQTRSKDRIRRIGEILGRSLVQAVPPQGDEVEEMMRVAVDLSDRDVLLLAEIARLQGPAVTGDGQSTQLSQTTWAATRLSDFGMTVEDVFSSGPKLESFGLARETLESRRGTNVPKPWPYALLPKGLRFLEFVDESSADIGSGLIRPDDSLQPDSL